MTAEVTLWGHTHRTWTAVLREDRADNMLYTIDDGQLLGLWTVVRFLGLVREIPDDENRSELLTRAQCS